MNLHILCGIPGCGKSTLVQNIGGYVVSTDSLRKYLWGSESVLTHDRFVFKMAESITAYMLTHDSDVIFDATNITPRARKRNISLGKKCNAAITLHWIDCPLEVALVRNSKRDRHVPTHVIHMLHNKFVEPSIAEGMDLIKVYNADLEVVREIRALG